MYSWFFFSLDSIVFFKVQATPLNGKKEKKKEIDLREKTEDFVVFLTNMYNLFLHLPFGFSQLCLLWLIWQTK